jgi:hypothetical protein
VSQEHTSNFLQQGAEGRRGGSGERGARLAHGVERRRLILGGDGGQHGRLAPADGAAAELDAHGDVGERGEARGRDGEGATGGTQSGRAPVARHVHGEGLLKRVEAERAHRGGRGRGRRDGGWWRWQAVGGGSASWATPPKGERGGACTTMDGGGVVAKGRDGWDEGGGGGGGGARSDRPG